jgi:outer membrane receptor protein involved in Fe transport
VELLPGASSVLYGANAFNGILYDCQSPFTSQGLRYAKFGQNKSKAAGTNDYVDYGIRMAHAFSPNLPQKLTLPMRGTDWYATNYDDKTNVGRDRSHVNYDGINVYGDEVKHKKGVLQVC